MKRTAHCHCYCKFQIPNSKYADEVKPQENTQTKTINRLLAGSKSTHLRPTKEEGDRGIRARNSTNQPMNVSTITQLHYSTILLL